MEHAHLGGVGQLPQIVIFPDLPRGIQIEFLPLHPLAFYRIRYFDPSRARIS